MEAERARIAAERRAEGRERAEAKRAEADKQRTVILANAYRDSEIIRGEGDATAAEIYALAYEKDPDFYAFYRSLDAYRRSIGNSGDIIVVDPKNEFFRFTDTVKNAAEAGNNFGRRLFFFGNVANHSQAIPNDTGLISFAFGLQGYILGPPGILTNRQDIVLGI